MRIPSSFARLFHRYAVPMTIHRWTDLPQDHPMDLIDRRRIVGDNAMISEVFLHKGFKLATHSHANEQIAMVMSGRVRFTINEGMPDEDTCELEGGQVIVFQPNVPHAAEALEDTLIYDVFSPPSDTTGVDQAIPSRS